jgi:hypothetical protein
MPNRLPNRTTEQVVAYDHSAAYSLDTEFVVFWKKNRNSQMYLGNLKQCNLLLVMPTGFLEL